LKLIPGFVSIKNDDKEWMTQDDVNGRVCLQNLAGVGHIGDYKKEDEKVSKMYRSARSQAIETRINEGVEHRRRRIQKYYFPDFGVMLPQSGE
jgi:hypothetical protein